MLDVLDEAIRDALIADSVIASRIDVHNGDPAVFTRRPVPEGAPNRMIIVNPPTTIDDQDALTSRRPVVTRDLAVYGNQPDHYRDVERVGYRMRELFQRNKWAITPVGYAVIEIIARGPFPGPTDDDKTVARVVMLTIRLREAA